MTRSPDILELIETSPLTFTLAAVIALRARYRPGVSLKGLQPGEAFLGDYRRCGLTRQEYRTAMANLTKWGFAAFRSTNKGTVATLIDSRLFDVLNESVNQQANHQPTNEQPLTKKGKKEKKGKNLTETGGFVNSTASSSKSIPLDVQEVFAFAARNDIPLKISRRFIRFNNLHGWAVKNWRGAFLKFSECCDSTNPADAVPVSDRASNALEEIDRLLKNEIIKPKGTL